MTLFLDHSMLNTVLRRQNLCKLGSLLLAEVYIHTGGMHAVKQSSVFLFQSREFILVLGVVKQSIARL